MNKMGLQMNKNEPVSEGFHLGVSDYLSEEVNMVILHASDWNVEHTQKWFSMGYTICQKYEDFGLIDITPRNRIYKSLMEEYGLDSDQTFHTVLLSKSGTLLWKHEGVSDPEVIQQCRDFIHFLLVIDRI
ncbi:MAG: hypothetical protein KC713_00225 [Candidatus Omnitrophica bacterium]|nr:hypothetical protein [Candidatus Omnitrophota bacterium]